MVLDIDGVGDGCIDGLVGDGGCRSGLVDCGVLVAVPLLLSGTFTVPPTATSPVVVICVVGNKVVVAVGTTTGCCCSCSSVGGGGDLRMMGRAMVGHGGRTTGSSLPRRALSNSPDRSSYGCVCTRMYVRVCR